MNFEKLQELVKENILGTRKGSDEPAYMHSWRVADRLKNAGYPEDVVIAGLLHDIIEDSQITYDDLSSMGVDERILGLVRLCSHDENIANSDARWVVMIGKIIESGNDAAMAIKLVDVLDNSTTCQTMRTERRLFMRFTKGPLMYSISENVVKDELRKDLKEIIDNSLRKEGIAKLLLCTSQKLTTLNTPTAKRISG